MRRPGVIGSIHRKGTIAVLACVGVVWLLGAAADAERQARPLPPRGILGPASAVEILEDGSTVRTVTHPDGRVTALRGAQPSPAAPNG